VDSHKGRITLMRLSENQIADRPNSRLRRTTLGARKKEDPTCNRCSFQFSRSR
jgi:hypothetical protein